MTNALVHLVETERRGVAATSKISAMVLGIWAFVAGTQWPVAGWLSLAVITVVLARGVLKDRAYRKLLDERNAIESVTRVKQFGRPALRIVFYGGGRVTLPTWNTDRERVIAALETRELPPARLLR